MIDFRALVVVLVVTGAFVIAAPGLGITGANVIWGSIAIGSVLSLAGFRIINRSGRR